MAETKSKYLVLIGHNCPKPDGEEQRFDEGKTVTSYPEKYRAKALERGLIEEVK